MTAGAGARRTLRMFSALLYEADLVVHAQDERDSPLQVGLSSEAMAAMWRWSVPQQPPTTFRCGRGRLA
jgi:hypothetical protein